MANLALCNTSERFFTDFSATALGLFGWGNALTYGDAGSLRGQLATLVTPAAGYDVLLIAGHGTDTRFATLLRAEWDAIVTEMVRLGQQARVVILDGCQSAGFLRTFLPLVVANPPATRAFNAVVCNYGDASTTVFGQMRLGHTVAEAIAAKIALEAAQPVRPAKFFIVPADTPETAGFQARFVAGEFRLSRFPELNEAGVFGAFDDFADWMATPLNRAALVAEAARQAALPADRWSNRLFRPTAIAERTQAGGVTVRMCGPFDSADDMKAAYEHWQQFGPGGNAANVDREHQATMMAGLAAAGIATVSSSVGLDATAALLVERIVPPPVFARPARPGTKKRTAFPKFHV